MGAENYAASSGSQEEYATEEQRLLEKNGRYPYPSDDLQIEVPTSRFGFNAGHRPYRDVAYGIVFLLLITGSVGVGLFGAFNQNVDYQFLNSANYDRSKGCSVSDGYYGGSMNSERVAHHGSRLVVRNLSNLDEVLEKKDLTWKAVTYTLLATLIISVGVVAPTFLWVLKTYTREFIYVTLPASIILVVGFVATFFVLCIGDESCSESFNSNLQFWTIAFLVAFSVIFLFILYKNLSRVEMTIRVIRTAAEALSQNTGLLVLLPVLNLFYCVYLMPAFLFLYFAYTNGRIVPHPDLVENPQLNCGPNSQIQCCVWQVDAWVPFYITLTGFVMLWGASIVSEVNVYTIAGTISQWYFSTTESSNLGSTRRSLGHALGPSFGTLSISGLVTAIVHMIRAASESSRAQRNDVGFAAIILRACLECILSFVEFLTKFTTIFASITGDDFCSSADLTYNLLKRNSLSTLVVETVSGQLLTQAVFVFSAVYGLLLWGLLCIFLEDRNKLGLVALVSGLIVLVVLIYFSRILHNVIDTVYICYAMDIDENEVSKADVHDVYILLPPSQDGTASVAVPKDDHRC